ncbi:hypothetical protein SAMN04488028_107203 [Reichenbachiella agariperforans]|uniref:Uncharacterized protein n=1 Tax=Reichenbachiella agariperforans TaxID=156994 RepID=A0A1M6UNH7_REIAG|nr:hypothetical protein SAMN04488028_107203 [Reichenbachiella agariperforans]
MGEMEKTKRGKYEIMIQNLDMPSNLSSIYRTLQKFCCSVFGQHDTNAVSSEGNFWRGQGLN